MTLAREEAGVHSHAPPLATQGKAGGARERVMPTRESCQLALTQLFLDGRNRMFGLAFEPLFLTTARIAASAQW
jgi:hypothetical protein